MKFTGKLKKLSHRVILLFIIISLLPLLILGTTTIYIFYDTIDKEILDKVEQVAKRKQDRINTYFQERLNDIRVLSISPTTINAIKSLNKEYYGFESTESINLKEKTEQVARFYRQYIDTAGYYDAFLISLEGDVIFSVDHESDYRTNLFTGRYKDTELARLFKNSMSINEPEISNFRYYEPSKEPAAFVTTAIMEDGKVLGILALQLSTDSLNNLIVNTIGLGMTGETFCFAKNDSENVFRLMAPLRNSKAKVYETLYQPNDPLYSLMEDTILGNEGSGILADYRQKETISVWKYIPHIRWGMIVKINTEEVFEQANLTLYYASMEIVIILMVSILLGYILSRSIVMPIMELSKMTKEISEKGFITSTSSFKRSDELGDLTQSFKNMSERVFNSQAELSTKVKERTEELEAVNNTLKKELQFRESAEKRLQLMAMIFEATDEAIVITNEKSEILEINQAYTRITGFNKEELIGQNPSKLKSDRHDKIFYDKMWTSLSENGTWSGEIWDRKKSGEIYPKWLTINALFKNGKVVYYVGIFTDITVLKETESQLKQLAYHDTLTSLYNRSYFNEKLVQDIIHANRNGTKIALLLIDLDKFKMVNDTLGHSIGDKLIVEVAERLIRISQGSGMITRLGGDEFIIELTEVQHSEDPARLADRIIEELKMPFIIEGQKIYIGSSIGISLFPEDCDNSEELIKNADLAMYHSKGIGGNQFSYFTEAIQKKISDRFKIEKNLRQAVSNKEFKLLFQKQIFLKDNKVTGVEALIRWDNKELGMVSPDKFIPIAEDSELINQIGKFVLCETFSKSMKWGEMGIDLKIAVNLSPKQMIDSDLIKQIKMIVDEKNVDTQKIELEITETALISNFEKTYDTIVQLKDMGFNISLDDFGTGYSSLSYLKRFPFDKLKIDKSFITDLTRDKNDRELVRAILKIGQSLGLLVVAEGVETKEQYEFLLNEGCDYVQGYYFARPEESEVIESNWNAF